MDSTGSGNNVNKTPLNVKIEQQELPVVNATPDDAPLIKSGASEFGCPKVTDSSNPTTTFTAVAENNVHEDEQIRDIRVYDSHSDSSGPTTKAPPVSADDHPDIDELNGVRVQTPEPRCTERNGSTRNSELEFKCEEQFGALHEGCPVCVSTSDMAMNEAVIGTMDVTHIISCGKSILCSPTRLSHVSYLFCPYITGRSSGDARQLDLSVYSDELHKFADAAFACSTNRILIACEHGDDKVAEQIFKMITPAPNARMSVELKPHHDDAYDPKVIAKVELQVFATPTGHHPGMPSTILRVPRSLFPCKWQTLVERSVLFLCLTSALPLLFCNN